MKDLIPYRGLPAVVVDALAALECASQFDGHEAHYRTVLQARDQRIAAFLLPVLPTAALGALLIWALQSIGWLPDSAPWAYAFGPVLFVGLVMAVARPNAARDDARIGAALRRWRQAARARGLTR
ncbi:MAG TPA: hypothetical protein VJR58_10175 [Vineibacter sp.]|nr:hypothetical protein [Vineibacter sp.]